MIEKVGSLEGIPGLVEYLQDLPDTLMPTEAELRKNINSRLVLSNKSYPREAAIRKVVDLVVTWFKKHGKETTIRLINTYLVGKTYTIIRRLDDGSAEHAEGNRGDQDQPGDVRTGPVLVEGYGSHRKHDRKEGIHLIEGGSLEGGEARIGAAEPPAGELHRECESTGEGVSRSLVLLELAEHTKDLQVFQKAYSGIRARVRTVEDEGRLMKLATWSGTTATLGLLELVVHNIERVIEELKEIIRKIDAGTISNLDEE